MILIINSLCAQDFTHLTGDYLGLLPPGSEPTVFARGIISDKIQQHGYPTFSPDGTEVYWQANRVENGEWVVIVLCMNRVDNKWNNPEITPFGSGPVFSPDGQKLYFNSKEDGNYPCFVEKQNDKWGKPKSLNLVSHYPELKFVYNLSVTNNSTLYFLGYAEGYWNNFGIYRSELVNGKYKKPEFLPKSINLPNDVRNWTPFVAPDESYLLFSSTRGLPSTDQGDIFISFRKPSGGWTGPMNLGSTINSNKGERFPCVSPDGKYLFFTRDTPGYDEDIYWVGAKIIEEIRAAQTN